MATINRTYELPNGLADGGQINIQVSESGAVHVAVRHDGYSVWGPPLTPVRIEDRG